MTETPSLMGRVAHDLNARMQRFAAGWTTMGELMLGLRVAVVPVVSVLIGIAMYYRVAQVHDLFLETVGAFQGGVGLWALFYVCIMLGWVLPVYFSTRWILARYNALADTTHEDALIPVAEWVRLRLPQVACVALPARRSGGAVPGDHDHAGDVHQSRRSEGIPAAAHRGSEGCRGPSPSWARTPTTSRRSKRM